MIEKNIHQIWVGENKLEEKFVKCTNEIKSMHKDWNYYLWNEENILSLGMRKEYLDKLRCPAERADIIRLIVLYKFGGFYLDIDFKLIRPLDDLLKHKENFIIAELKKNRVNNAFLASKKSNPYVLKMIKDLKPRIFYGYDKNAAGPLFVNDFIRKNKDFRNKIKILPVSSFYALENEIVEETFGIHLVERSWLSEDGWKPRALVAERKLYLAEREINELKNTKRISSVITNKNTKINLISKVFINFFKHYLINLKSNFFLYLSRKTNKVFHRNYLPILLNKYNLNGVGLEIGVKKGIFSEIILNNWQCKSFNVVDPWKNLNDETYIDSANVDDDQHYLFYLEARVRLAKHKSKTTFHKMTSAEAVKKFPDNHFDFIYIDARHGYHEVLEDLNLWGKKLKKNGILAGHDYLNGEINGTVFGVKKAVNNYIINNKINKKRLKITYEPWPSFYIIPEEIKK